MYRVFISYSHQDKDLVMRIRQIIEENGLYPKLDQNFAIGHGFHDQIKNWIAHAHIFLPVITPTADERKWVHQEIGFAIAMNIPVLPVTCGKLPGEMIQQIQAVQFDGDLDKLRKNLSREVIAGLVQRFSSTTLASYQCADYAEDRAIMIARHCNDVQAYGEYALVRQKGALSSFHIPDKTIHHPVWKARYGNFQRGMHHCELQLRERQAMTAHAKVHGCKLIVNPYLTYKHYGPEARIVRLQCLLEFLESMPDHLCRVAINRDMDHDQSLTVLGDWFFAESVSARSDQGYRQTIFTRHAPSMMSKIDAFDQEFNEHLGLLGWPMDQSRINAIRTIQEIVNELKAS